MLLGAVSLETLAWVLEIQKKSRILLSQPKILRALSSPEC